MRISLKKIEQTYKDKIGKSKTWHIEKWLEH